MCLDLLISLPL
jgi:hypothetical protein